MLCSSLQALVLLDITPDQSMVDEGMAREVINRIQKLRKKVCQVKNKLLFWSFVCFLFGLLGRMREVGNINHGNRLMIISHQSIV